MALAVLIPGGSVPWASRLRLALGAYRYLKDISEVIWTTVAFGPQDHLTCSSPVFRALESSAMALGQAWKAHNQFFPLQLPH
jgi:hypothetical protein